MTTIVYRERDYLFGKTMLSLRIAIGLTQKTLAEELNISRRAVGKWEIGGSYPKAEHLKALIELAVKQQAFPTGHEVEEIRALWKLAHQKVLLDERWLTSLLTEPPTEPELSITPSSIEEPVPVETIAPNSAITRLAGIGYLATLRIIERVDPLFNTLTPAQRIVLPPNEDIETGMIIEMLEGGILCFQQIQS